MTFKKDASSTYGSIRLTDEEGDLQKKEVLEQGTFYKYELCNQSSKRIAFPVELSYSYDYFAIEDGEKEHTVWNLRTSNQGSGIALGGDEVIYTLDNMIKVLKDMRDMVKANPNPVTDYGIALDKKDKEKENV